MHRTLARTCETGSESKRLEAVDFQGDRAEQKHRITPTPPDTASVVGRPIRRKAMPREAIPPGGFGRLNPRGGEQAIPLGAFGRLSPQGALLGPRDLIRLVMEDDNTYGD